jgi:hypothetical protein
MAAVVILLVAGVARAQDLPRAEDVFKKNVEASGGRDAYKALKAIHYKGTIALGGMAADLEVFQARPDKRLARISVNGMVVAQEGYDGKVAWEVSPGGPRVKDGKDLEAAREEANFDADIYEPGTYKAATVVAREAFEGAECYKVKIERNSGKTVTRYFDVKTGFQVGGVTRREGAGGDVDVTTHDQDFKPFGKFTIATKVTQKAGGREVTIRLNSVTYDDVDAKVFELPDEVKALLKK